MVSYAPAPDPHSICKGWIGFPKKESRLCIVGYTGRLLRMCFILYVSIVPIINIVLLVSFFKSICRFVGTGPGPLLEPKAVVASCVSDECECGLWPRREFSLPHDQERSVDESNGRLISCLVKRL